jgi:hypothetical protein
MAELASQSFEQRSSVIFANGSAAIDIDRTGAVAKSADEMPPGPDRGGRDFWIGEHRCSACSQGGPLGNMPTGLEASRHLFERGSMGTQALARRLGSAERRPKEKFAGQRRNSGILDAADERHVIGSDEYENRENQ